MKVLQINKFLYPKGGAETYMFQLSKALEEKGIKIAFWGMENENNSVADTFKSFAKDISYNNVSFLNSIKNAQRTIYSVENIKRIRKILDAFQPDLVHLHNYNFQLTPGILPEIKKHGIKIVQTVHDSQMVCPYHRLYNFQQNKVCTKCVTGSFINCIKDRCFDGSVLKSTIGTIESVIYHRLDFYNKYIDRFIAPGGFMAKMIRNRISKPIEIIPNFTEKLTDIPKKDSDFYLYYGRISEEKGILELIDIFKSLPLHLVIVGKGEEVALLKNKIKNLKNISFWGYKSGKELFEIVSKAKYVIQPSKWYENCPMTVIESFTYGTPVIAANHSGFKDLIEDGKTGFLLDFTKPGLVKDQFLEIDRKNTKKLKANIDRFYQNHLKKDIHIRKILDLYDAVLKND